MGLNVVSGKKPSVNLGGTITCLYGEKKAGKSTFAAQFPKPVFLDCEGGLRTVEAPDGNIPDHVPINSWEGFTEAVSSLEEDTGGYETVVVDGLNELWSYLEAHILKKYNAKHNNDGELGYGNGKKIMQREFRYWFQRLRNLDITIVMCAHQAVEEFEHNGVNLSRHIPYVDDTKEGLAWRNIKPAVSMVLYVSKESTKEGVVHQLRCQGNQFYEAGNPFNLPELIQFDYNQLVKAIEACNKKNK